MKKNQFVGVNASVEAIEGAISIGCCTPEEVIEYLMEEGDIDVCVVEADSFAKAVKALALKQVREYMACYPSDPEAMSRYITGEGWAA